MYNVNEIMTKTERNDLIETCKIGKFADARLHDYEVSTLSPEKCSELVTLVKRGEAARQKLVEGNLYRVSEIVDTYRGKGMSIPDLMQEGTIGLINYIDKVIDGDIEDYDSVIEIQRYIKYTIDNFIETNYNPDETMLGDDDYAILSKELEDILSHDYLRSTIMDTMTGFTQREKNIIIWRYGLDGGPRRIRNDIANELGICQERVRQIELKALRKFRHPRRARKLRDFLYD